MSNDRPTGWICPRCDAVNAPMLLKCTCGPQKQAPEKPAAADPLELFRKLADDLKEEMRRAQIGRPIHIEYPWWFQRPYYPHYTRQTGPYDGLGITWADNQLTVNSANLSAGGQDALSSENQFANAGNVSSSSAEWVDGIRRGGVKQ